LIVLERERERERERECLGSKGGEGRTGISRTYMYGHLKFYNKKLRHVDK